MNPTTKTAILITLFTLAAVYSFCTTLDYISVTLPLFVFYILFMINSFFSIRLFFGIIPPKIMSQTLIDSLLGIVYFILAFNLKNPLVFAYFIAFFFIFGSMKYVYLLPILTNQQRLLRRKIFVNILGILLGLGAVGGILLGWEMAVVWAIPILFGIANIFMFWVSPLYRLD